MDTDQFRQLEESLWRHETRYDRDYLRQVLHPDFFEFGRSGRAWSRDDTLASAPGAIDARLADFAVHRLGDDAVLVTYTSYVRHEQVDVGRRSSVWVRAGSSWQLRFHQGTPVQDSAIQGSAVQDAPVRANAVKDTLVQDSAVKNTLAQDSAALDTPHPGTRVPPEAGAEGPP
jgi:hypothetical protein